jgi:hypothetical protein
MSNA